MNRWRRKRVTVDPHIQGRFCVRICMYWTTCFMSIAFLLACNALLSDSEHSTQLWATFGKVASLSFLALPMMLLDGLVFSNRFCGPAHRLRHGLADLAAGKSVSKITLRRGDFYSDIAEDFNRVVERVQELEERENDARKGERDALSVTDEVSADEQEMVLV